MFEKIKSVLRGGYLLIRPNQMSGRYVIKKKEILLKLISLINGSMRTPKIEALHRLIDFINFKYNSTIPQLKIDLSPIDHNSWLSGFIEADGNFYCSWKKSKKSQLLDIIPINIIYYLRLSQRHFYTRRVDLTIKEDYIDIMINIGQALNTPVLIIHRKRNSYEENAYLIRSDTLESKEKVFNYLNNYPLFGYKYFAFFYLNNIHNLIRNSKHKNLEGRIEFIRYSNLVKYNPEIHTWEHLHRFYTK